MQNAESLSRDQIQQFLRSSEPIEFASSGRDERYLWVERVLVAQKYRGLGKGERGLVRAYLRKVTGLSEAQSTRLIRAFLDHGVVRAQPYQRHTFRSQVHGRRHCVIGGSGSGTWAIERGRHPADFAARLRTVRREAVRTAGEDQRGALVQSAGERA